MVYQDDMVQFYAFTSKTGAEDLMYWSQCNYCYDRVTNVLFNPDSTYSYAPINVSTRVEESVIVAHVYLVVLLCLRIFKFGLI